MQRRVHPRYLGGRGDVDPAHHDPETGLRLHPGAEPKRLAQELHERNRERPSVTCLAPALAIAACDFCN